MINRKERLENMLQENPKDSFLRFAMAKEYEKLTDLNQAIRFYENIIQDEPNYVGAYYHLGKCKEELELNEQALEVYAKGIEIAQEIKDLHSLSELKSAKMNLEMEM